MKANEADAFELVCKQASLFAAKTVYDDYITSLQKLWSHIVLHSFLWS